MKVVCVTTWSPYNQPLADVTLPNLYEYAERHGYDVYEHRIEDNKFHFKKHEVFVELFKDEYDIIFYKDIDSMITNQTIPIESFLDGGYDFYITRDKTELNGGVMILRSSKWCKEFNNIILHYDGKLNNEQNAINLIYQFSDVKEKIKVLSQSTINSYLYELYPEYGKLTHEEGGWEEGDFILHLPAIPLERRIEILKNIKVIR